MLAITVSFKNGKQFDGLLWSWRPESGYLEALHEKDGRIRKISLDTVRSGTVFSTRVKAHDDPHAVDLVAKAVAEGWAGK